MDETAVPDWYVEACRRAVASGRRRRAARAAAEAPAGWPEFGPPVGLAEGAVQAADREIARQTALRARALTEFAAARPAEADRAQGEPGAMSPERWAARPELLREVSEWAAPELVVALSRGRLTAERLLEQSLTLVQRLPGVLAALQTGALHPGHLPALIEHVAPIEDAAVRAEVERVLLWWLADRAAARKVTTPAQLGEKVRREVLKRDARAAARRLEAAIRERGVQLHPEPTAGMAAVSAVLTGPEAQVLYAALGAYADALPKDPADTRTRGQKMADCLLDLVLRPGECELPPVRVVLQLVASVQTVLGGDEPGELGGQVVPAEMVRALLHALTGHPAAGPDDSHTADDAASCTVGETDGGDAATDPEGPCDWAGLEPRDDPAVLDQAWQELYQRELVDWWAEVERRLLAGELGAGPDPIPEQVLAGWAGEPDAPGGRVIAAGDLLDAHLLDPADLFEPEDLIEPEDSVDAVDGGSPFDTGGPFGGGSPFDIEVPLGGEGPPGSAPPGGDGDADPPRIGWWAAADDAVARAGAAVDAAQRALGQARRLVRTAQRADAADETAWRASPAGRVDGAVDALAALATAGEAQREWLADLLDATAGGGLAERPRLALADALSGALIALTDLPELRRAAHCGRSTCARAPENCSHELTGRPGLGPPGPTDGYRPSAALDRYLRARDRRCRFPGVRHEALFTKSEVRDHRDHCVAP